MILKVPSNKINKQLLVIHKTKCKTNSKTISKSYLDRLRVYKHLHKISNKTNPQFRIMKVKERVKETFFGNRS